MDRIFFGIHYTCVSKKKVKNISYLSNGLCVNAKKYSYPIIYYPQWGIAAPRGYKIIFISSLVCCAVFLSVVLHIQFSKFDFFTTKLHAKRG